MSRYLESRFRMTLTGTADAPPAALAFADFALVKAPPWPGAPLRLEPHRVSGLGRLRLGRFPSEDVFQRHGGRILLFRL